MTDGEFHGLTAVVTGGASGIGLATARLLADRGARVAVFDLAGQIAAGVPEPLHGVPVDVTDDASVLSGIAEVADTFGGIDILINNAGIGAQGTVADNEIAEWQRVLDVNVLGAVRVSRAALPHLRRSAHAAIVNTCSVAAIAGLPQPRAVLRVQGGDPVADPGDGGRPRRRGNPGQRRRCRGPRTPRGSDGCSRPQTIRPPNAPRSRADSRTDGWSAADEVAGGIAYLASPAASSTTGTTLAVDGGMVRTPAAPADSALQLTPVTDRAPIHHRRIHHRAALTTSQSRRTCRPPGRERGQPSPGVHRCANGTTIAALSVGVALALAACSNSNTDKRHHLGAGDLGAQRGIRPRHPRRQRDICGFARPTARRIVGGVLQRLRIGRGGRRHRRRPAAQRLGLLDRVPGLRPAQGGSARRNHVAAHRLRQRLAEAHRQRPDPADQGRAGAGAGPAGHRGGRSGAVRGGGQERSRWSPSTPGRTPATSSWWSGRTTRPTAPTPASCWAPSSAARAPSCSSRAR